MQTFERDVLQQLFEALERRGYALVGPVVRDGAIVYDELGSTDDLPVGMTDEQDAGIYRLRKRDDDALFGYVVGPDSWKRFLLPPSTRLWGAEATGEVFEIRVDSASPPKYALIGARACELEAIAIQDKVFSKGDFVDPIYTERRQGVFVVAVNCGQAAKTCFCTSMNTGPRVKAGYDLALTEVVEESRHYFVVESGSGAGAEVLGELPCRDATEGERAASEATTKHALEQIERSMDTEGIRDLLCGNYEHPRWEEISKRCLTCANCTLVCPTCFCTTVEDTTDLTGEHVERWRKWDSCFTAEFSYIYGGTIRSSASARYRHWMTHKLATWFDQFGSSGCVGCGRCIAWCPVGIDITEEAAAIRADDRRKNQEPEEQEEVQS
jgi:formate hydrogenlyase subunit 6/NADH:ubiquinone oxidoreductase subunit I